MTARIRKVDAANPDGAILGQAVKLLKKGEVVVCPTDTGYAFAANALDVRAITRVFALKGRSFSNPIHIAVGSIGEAEKYALVNDEARYLAEHYLPGGLTLVMKRKDTIPAMLVAGMDTVGVRIPDNRVILELFRQSGFPLTTTSANVSGRPGTYSVEEVSGQLGENIEGVAMILDGGPVKTREVSTIVDVSVRPAQLIRQGLVSWLEIRDGLRRFGKPEDTKE